MNSLFGPEARRFVGAVGFITVRPLAVPEHWRRTQVHGGDRQEQRRGLLAEQAERAGDRGRREPPERARRGRERQHRSGGLQRRRPATCPFTVGVGGSSVQFSFDSGHTWIQPTYTAGQRGTASTARIHVHAERGPIGTLPGTSRQGSSRTAIPQWRSDRAKLEWHLLLGERLMALPRGPDLELQRRSQ
jgi:hypothetical protein